MKSPLSIVLFGARLVALVIAASAPAQQEVSSRERAIMQTVAEILERAHYSEHPLDDEISERAFRGFLQSLDPLRLYFYRSDVEEFARSKSELDDMLRDGRTTFAIRVYERLLKRIGARDRTIDSLLAGEFDFTADESFVSEPKLREYPRSAQEARDLWRRRLKFLLLSMRHDGGVSPEEARERVRKQYRRLHERYRKQPREETVAQFINAVATSFDPHTVYFGRKAYEDFKLGVTLNYQGIGALLGQDDDGSVVIRQVLPGGAVARYGKLQGGDRILAVGQGSDGPLVEVSGMRIDDVVKLIRGKPGTVVRLAVTKAAGGPRRVHALERAEIKLEEGAAKGEVIEHKAGDRRVKIGKIDLPGFYGDVDPTGKVRSSSTVDVRRLLRDFRRQGVDGVILDLRHNGGGFLPEALGVAGLFLDGQAVVQVKQMGRHPRVLSDPDPGAEWSGPLVVLVGRASASASEIVAGALRDHRRALLVGADTHGKGTVQTTIDLAEVSRSGRPGELGVLKITVQKFFLPGGDSTQLRGVDVDLRLPSMIDALDLGESKLPHALSFDRVSPTPLPPRKWLNQTALDELARASELRRAGSSQFQRLERQIVTYRKLRKRSRIPLAEEAFRAMQETTQAEEVEAGEQKDLELDEAVAITADYIRALLRRN